MDAPPEGDGWLHEVKHDGFRTLTLIQGGKVRAQTMNGHDWSERYHRLCEAAAALPCASAVLDGEAVVQNGDGMADFGALRRASGEATSPLSRSG